MFIVGDDGNEEYNSVLLKGLTGEVVLGRKEVTDLKGSDKYKVYLEWMEVQPKQKR